MDKTLPNSMKNANVTIERAGGRQLRTATWRLDDHSDHPPLLFFNGIGANIESVAPMADAMTERAFIICDMPGTGDSPDPVVPYNHFTMSWTIARLLDRLQVARVDIAGVSWGGALAQQFALQHPGRVRKLVLAASAAGMAMVPGDAGTLSALTDPVRHNDRAYMNEVFASLYGVTMGDEARAEKAKHIGRLTPPSPIGYGYQLFSMMGWTSLPALPFLTIETLIMIGGDDRLVPPLNGHILNWAIPNSRLQVFEEAGHLFLLTHPEESLAAIRAFLDGVDSTGSRPERV